MDIVLTDEQLSLILSNAKQHTIDDYETYPVECCCAGATAVGCLNYADTDDFPGSPTFSDSARPESDYWVARCISNKIFEVARLHGVAANTFYETPDKLLTALEEAKLA